MNFSPLESNLFKKVDVSCFTKPDIYFPERKAIVCSWLSFFNFDPCNQQQGYSYVSSFEMTFGFASPSIPKTHLTVPQGLEIRDNNMKPSSKYL